MSYLVIGYQVKIGSMKKNGEDISWNNRVVRFITDVGCDSENVGFSPFEFSFKLEELSKILNVQPNLVNDALNQLLQKEVYVNFAPVNGELKVKSFGLKNKS